MFKVLEPGARKRRVWSAGTITLSVAAHVAILGIATYASLHASPPPPPPEVYVPVDVPPPPPPPVKVIDPPAPPPQADQPAMPATPGTFIEVHPPEVVPDRIPAIDPTQPPLPPQDGAATGTGGDVIGTPTGQPSTGSTALATDGYGPDVVSAAELGEIPALANTSEVQRILQRTYPPLLREAGIMGEARLQFVINTDGRVDMSTVQVVGATNEQFGDAAKRAVEHFRFKPASMNGDPVRVLTTIPIRFTVQH